MERALFSLVNAGFELLEKSATLSPDDIDLLFVNDFGFPRRLGGPLFWAEKDKGLQTVLLAVLKYSELYKNDRWKPSELLREVVKSGSSVKEELFFKRSRDEKGSF